MADHYNLLTTEKTKFGKLTETDLILFKPSLRKIPLTDIAEINIVKREVKQEARFKFMRSEKIDFITKLNDGTIIIALFRKKNQSKAHEFRMKIIHKKFFLENAAFFENLKRKRTLQL